MGCSVPCASSGPVVDAQVRARVALACTFCHGALVRTEAVFCAACLAPHHADCVHEHGVCSAAGCGERRIVRPDRWSRGRRRCAWAVLLGVVVLVAGVMVTQRAEARELERELDGRRRVIEIVIRKLYRLEEERRVRSRERDVEERFRALAHLLHERGLDELKELRFAQVREAISAAEYFVSEATRDRWKLRLSELRSGDFPPRSLDICCRH